MPDNRGTISSRFRLRDNETVHNYFITAKIMETQAPDLGLNSSVPPTSYSKYLLRTPAAYLKYLLLFLNFCSVHIIITTLY